MPVIHVDRDPVLISIDRQRLEDLGIPVAVGHECAAILYGPVSIMRPVLIVPSDWEYALPEEWPPQEEWDTAAWELAQTDSSNERPEHTRPIGMADYIGGSAAAMLILWLFTCTATILCKIALLLIPTGGRRPPVTDGSLGDAGAVVGIVLGILAGALCMLLASPLVGMLAWVGGRLLRNPFTRWCIAVFLLFGYVGPVVVFAFLVMPSTRRQPQSGEHTGR